MAVLDGRAVVPRRPTPLGQTVVVGDDRTPVAHGAEILGRVEAECTGLSHAAASLSFVAGAVRLGGILHDDQAVLLGDCADRVHVDGMSVKVNGDNRFCSRSDGR